MPTPSIRAALERVEAGFTAKPQMALQSDAPARAVFAGGLAAQVLHPQGHSLRTDMPAPMGGTGEQVTSGWLMRAALASCTSTMIAMRAARLGIEFTRLEVVVKSRTDARGMLGLDDAVPAGPLDIDVSVIIDAPGVPEPVLAELVDWADRHSPVASALRRSMDVRVSVQAG
ncbi:MAG: hypothetical protein AVDCRST_MAG51-2928 [uncultured Ramlibacter sp.]|uniref:Bll5738 protein n=1 Tax=uncultured Ramlibacter sp. TaxID=260755 RepID=A0A6J4Q7M5_9BURK|nr:MAG: hypothetical protein AVDCRST_MAG51-2928 [uncultured Ramlibacter sp.]